MVEARLVVTALAMMCAMFLAGVHGLRHRIGIAILALLSVAWFTVDKLFEGEVLFQLSTTHALTSADIVGLLGLLVSGALLRRSRVPTPGRRTRTRSRRRTWSGDDSDRPTPGPTRIAREDV